MIPAFRCTNEDCLKVHKDISNGFVCTCGNKETTPIEVADDYFDDKIEGWEKPEEKQEELDSMAKKNNVEKKLTHINVQFDTDPRNEKRLRNDFNNIVNKLKTAENINISSMDKEKYDREQKEKKKVVEAPQKSSEKEEESEEWF